MHEGSRRGVINLQYGVWYGWILIICDVWWEFFVIINEFRAQFMPDFSILIFDVFSIIAISKVLGITLNSWFDVLIVLKLWINLI